MTLEAERQQVQEDIHPIAKYRILGTLSNLPEFQAAFTCAPGSAMVRSPQERCELW
jgi:predicted metalloendopeptidase